MLRSMFGFSGRSGFWWRKGVQVDIIVGHKKLIQAVVRADIGHNAWVLFGIYGPMNYYEKKEFWRDMERRINRTRQSWTIVGDLNVILHQHEKIGGREFHWNKGNLFRDFINNTGGNDLGASGNNFTQCNGRGHDMRIQERLDRVVCSEEWVLVFPYVGVDNLPIIGSNHGPIILNTMRDLKGWSRPFRFLEVWGDDPGCRDVVSNAWASRIVGYEGFILHTKLGITKGDLIEWYKRHFGVCQQRIKDLESQLTIVQNQMPSLGQIQEEACIQGELMET